VTEKPSEETLEEARRAAGALQDLALLYHDLGKEPRGNWEGTGNYQASAWTYCRQANAIREVLLHLGVQGLPPEPLNLDEVKTW
jgi:hypothetical protein